MTAAPSRVRVGAATLLPASRLLRGPAGEARVWPQTARLIARVAAGRGEIVPWRRLVEALYAPGQTPRAEDGGRASVHTVLAHARRALRDIGAGVGIAAVRERGLRLDAGAAAGTGPAVVDQRRDRARLLDASAAGASGAEMAARFGFKNARVAHVAVCKARRRLRAEAADAGAVP